MYHVGGVAAVATRLAPGEPMGKLGQPVVLAAVTSGGGSHVHQTDGASRQRLPAIRTRRHLNNIESHNNSNKFPITDVVDKLEFLESTSLTKMKALDIPKDYPCRNNQNR